MLVGTDGPIFLGTDSPKTVLAQKIANTQKGANGEKETKTSIFFQNDRSIARHKHAFRK